MIHTDPAINARLDAAARAKAFTILAEQMRAAGFHDTALRLESRAAALSRKEQPND